MIAPCALAADDRPPLFLCRAVAQALPETSQDQWHRLCGGRSNRVWRVGDIVVKLRCPESATPLFPNDSGTEALALQSLAPLGIAPQLLAQGETWLAWQFLSGAPWRGEGGIADLLGCLRRAPLRPGLPLRPMGARAIAQHAIGFAPSGLPALPALPDLQLPAPSLVHGDFVPGNILATADGLRLIDWQCPGLGDPVDDLALFLSPAMQGLYRGAPLSAEAVAAILAELPPDFAHRYLALRPILHWRIAAHCAFRARRGDTDYDLALRMELTAL